MEEHEKSKIKKPDFSKKLNSLWKDKRNYKKRLFIAIAPVFAMCYTFLFFGPVELTAFSHESLSFEFTDIIGTMALISIISFVILTLVISLLRGKIFNYVVTGVFAITLCGYLQGNFLNGDLGALTGDAIAWQKQASSMLINLGIWFVIILLLYLLLYFHKQIWKKVVLFASVILFLMQTVALGSICLNMDAYTTQKEEANFLSMKDFFEYSKEKNTFVFLLDRLDYDYITEVLDDNPDFFDQLDGFTNYTNATSITARTKPAANYILTNYNKDMFHVPAEEFFEKSWENNDDKNVLKDLSEAGYTIDMYTEISDMFGKGRSMENVVSNMSKEHSDVNKNKVAKKLIDLSAYRYAPVALKPFFWTFTDEVNKGAYKNDKPENVVYEIDETKYAKGIKNFKLTDQNYFKFYHFNGSHAPYTLKEDGTKSKKPTSAKIQTMGSFNILMNAFEEMKELGIYKDATIIITADHGYAVSDSKPLQKATRIGLFYKPSGSEGSALQQNNAPVSLDNVPATILKGSGLDYKAYGTPLDEVREDADVVRKHFKTVTNGGKEKEVYYYDVKGDASDFKNWIQTDVAPIEYPFY